jgi:hypothetical protein
MLVEWERVRAATLHSIMPAFGQAFECFDVLFTHIVEIYISIPKSHFLDSKHLLPSASFLTNSTNLPSTNPNLYSKTSHNDFLTPS